MDGIIYIFGPSCSGKSTLGKALHNCLEGEWNYIDRDLLIEKKICIESMADEVLEKKIQEIGNRIIIDTQIPYRDKRKGEIYCLLLPPLECLLERDEKRTKRLHRTETRANYARKYVIKTFKILSATDQKKFDLCLDSSSLSIDEVKKEVLNLLENSV